MKRILLYGSMLAALLASVSCQQDRLDPSVADGEVTVSITARIPSGMETKGFGDASGVDVVYYELWTSDFKTRLYPAEGSDAVWAEVTGGSATIDNLKFVRGDSYGIIFWAQDKDCKAYDVSDLSNVKIDYTVDETEVSGTGTGNEENRDAFYGCETFTVGHEGVDGKTFTLVRPFAQVNFASSKTAGGVLGEIGFEGYRITMPVASTFDTVNGKGIAHEDAARQTHTFTASAIASDAEIIDGHAHVAMNYIIPVGTGSQLIDIAAAFDVKQAGVGHTVEHKLSSIPVEGNHKTNLYGNLYTEDSKITVEFEEYSDDSNVKIVATVDDLSAALASATPGTVKEITLDSDIQFDGTVSLDIAAGCEVCIDLNGKTINVSSADNATAASDINNYGKLTLTGGKILASDDLNSRRCIYNRKGGTLVIDGVSFTQLYESKGAALNNAGTMVVEDADVDSKYWTIWNEAGADLTINGGTFSCNSYTGAGESDNGPTFSYSVRNTGAGTKCTINGGTFNCTHGFATLDDGSEMVINGGTIRFTLAEGLTAMSSHAFHLSGANTKLTVNDCTVDWKNDALEAGGSNLIYMTASAVAGNVVFNGGLFNNNKVYNETQDPLNIDFTDSGNAEYPWTIRK